MANYKEMYLALHDASSCAIDAIDNQHPDTARSLLVKGQQEAEKIYNKTTPPILSGISGFSESYHRTLEIIAELAETVEVLSQDERDELQKTVNRAFGLLSDRPYDLIDK